MAQQKSAVTREPAFWVTVHWPHRVGRTDVHSNVYLQDGKEQAGRDLDKGDQLLTYELGSGPTRMTKTVHGDIIKEPCLDGRQGIVTIATVAGPVEEREIAEAVEEYSDGKEVYWRWLARTCDEASNGFVPKAAVLDVLFPESPKYTFMGFGDLHSGLKRISAEQFNRLRSLFRSTPAREPIAPDGIPNRVGQWSEGGGEGPEHLHLKEYAAANPGLVLNEDSVKTHAIEFPFGTGDRADLVFVDRVGRVIGVEIEVIQTANQLEGLLQSIKYRFMLAVMFNQRFDEARSALVAYEIDDRIKCLAAQYDVKCVEVDRAAVRNWQKIRR
jgi:hypothetical protein